MSANVSDLSRLPVAAKLRLIESLWDELAADPSVVPFEEWQREELDSREAAAERSPDAGRPWEEVRARITGRHDT